VYRTKASGAAPADPATVAGFLAAGAQSLSAAANGRTAASRRTASDQSSSGMSSGRLGSLGVGFPAAMPLADSHDPGGRFARTRRQSRINLTKFA